MYDNGYLLKSIREELIYAIQLVMDGHSTIPYRTPKDVNVLDKDDAFMKQFNLIKKKK